MKRKFAIYGRRKEYLFEIKADSEQEAIKQAQKIDPDATVARIICPGNDLGVFGVN